MKFALICSISLFALLGLIEAAGYGYQQSFYHVPVPVLVPPPRGGGGTNGGFFALIGLLFIIMVLFGFNNNTTTTTNTGTSIVNLDG